MTDVRSGWTASSSTGRRVWRLSRIAVGPVICCLSVAAVFSVTLLGTGAPAGADQATQLQAQAAAITRELTFEQLQVGGYALQSQAAAARAAADEAALQQTQSAIGAIRRRVGRDQAELQRSAVKAYMNGGASGSGPALFVDQRVTAQSAVYVQVMNGDVAAAMGQLKADRHALAGARSTQQRLLAQDAAAQAQADTLLAQSQATEASLQRQSVQIQGALATAIAQRQAQIAASAAAARAAAAASQAASAGPVPSPGALPPFLACVLQAESGGEYQVVSPTGLYMGGFQFSQTTWNHAAILAGMPTLVGVPPNDASPADQNALAIALYNADGEQPWYDPCRS